MNFSTIVRETGLGAPPPLNDFLCTVSIEVELEFGM